VIGQLIALGLVLGSYAGAQYVRVWRPRKAGLRAAHRADAPPETSAAVSPRLAARVS
jgi:hypothetical protein